MPRFEDQLSFAGDDPAGRLLKVQVVVEDDEEREAQEFNQNDSPLGKTTKIMRLQAGGWSHRG
jgi:hypothetical protein